MRNEFSERIVSLRKENGWTQEYIAECCGVSRQAVAKWESGMCVPDIFRIGELAEIFRVDVAELLPNSKRKSYFRYFIDAIGTVIHGAYVIDLKSNTMSSVIGNFETDDETEQSKSFDLMLAQASGAIPDENQRKAFLDTFSRENLIKDYLEGKEAVGLKYEKQTAEGDVRLENTCVHFVREKDDDEMICVSLSRYITE